MREDYTTDTVCGTSSKPPLRYTQESVSDVESIREYTGTTCRMVTLFSIFGRNAHASTFRNGETVRYSVFGNRKAGRAEQPNACIVITLDNQAQ